MSDPTTDGAGGTVSLESADADDSQPSAIQWFAPRRSASSPKTAAKQPEPVTEAAETVEADATVRIAVVTPASRPVPAAPAVPVNETTTTLRISAVARDSEAGPVAVPVPATVETISERTMQLRVLPELEPEPDPGFAFTEAVGPDWTLPPSVEVGWSADSGRRRRMISRGLLSVLLLVQALLSLRLTNTAFGDEALYIWAGHVEIANLFHGVPNLGGFDGYFSGAPVLYPVLAAAVDSVWGLAGVRFMSLLFMLVATSCLYSITRRIFNERAGLCAAALFAFADPVLFMGNFATYDALAVCLLALSTWIVVYTAHRHWATVLCAAPVVSLACGVKYASALFLPTIALLLVLLAYQHHGIRAALTRGAVFTAGVVGIIGGALAATGYWRGIQSTTTARAHGTTGAGTILMDSATWGGLLFAVAVIGTVLYTRTARLSEVPGWRRAVPGARWRLALGLLLTSTALLPTLYQMHLQTEVSLQKHVGFGLFFAAPMAGVGVTRLMGAHFKFPQWAIAIGVAALTLGMTQSAENYGSWPNTTYLIPQLARIVRPGQEWLGDPQEGPIYYLSKEGLTSYTDWLPFDYIEYTGRKGRPLSGIPGYLAAIDDGYFYGVVLDYSNGLPAAEEAVRDEMRSTGRYRLQSALPYETSGASGHFEIWVKVAQPTAVPKAPTAKV